MIWYWALTCATIFGCIEILRGLFIVVHSFYPLDSIVLAYFFFMLFVIWNYGKVIGNFIAALDTINRAYKYAGYKLNVDKAARFVAEHRKECVQKMKEGKLIEFIIEKHKAEGVEENAIQNNG